MSTKTLSYSGYACAPYLHNQNSLELKDSWVSSKNIEKLYFVTGTFSSDSKPYFSTSANHYLLAKFKIIQLYKTNYLNMFKIKLLLFLILEIIFLKGKLRKKPTLFQYIISNMRTMMMIYVKLLVRY